MTRRILDATATDFMGMDASQLARSIRETEGRTISAEVICTYEPPIEGITHAEIAAAFGADIVVLDYYDPDLPVIRGLPDDLMARGNPIAQLKRLIGLPIGVNMAVTAQGEGAPLYTRRYSEERLEQVVRQGADILFLYGDPASGKNSTDVASAVAWSKSHFGKQLLVVGIPDVYFPAPTDGKTILSYKRAHEQLLTAGAEAIGLVMPGSKQSWRADATADLVDHVHALGGLAWLIMTGSVEGSPLGNIEQMALGAKMAGGDAFRLDEAGLSGMPLPENILEFALTIRGKRHTYRRMALSPLR